jgi:nucleotide-binding universal stress UspA family protein
MSTVEIRSILVATGLGPGTDLPVRVAGDLSARTGAALHLLHALELEPVPVGGGGGGSATNFRGLVERTGKEMRAQARRALPPGLEPSSSEVVVFVPYKAILNRALQVSADLIVLGAHRRRPRGDDILGPTPDRVIRSATAPCLIVPQHEPRPFRKIVAPLDLEMPAAAVLDLARRWATTFGVADGESAEIHLLYIVPDQGSLARDPGATEAYEAALLREIARSEARSNHDLAPSIRPVVRYGRPPAEAILHYLEEVDADLVVLGTRGFGAIRRALIGSVASTIARRALCPILLVPPVLWKGEERG